ncbi:MAG: hypothetical protein O3A10_11650 [Chloroflexi bacterium]|nr:hypothetical protein [Chloroflexota bacterium]
MFRQLQGRLEADLQLSRFAVAHGPTKGVARELNWIGMLRGFLPARYRVDHAFVVDSKGGISEQIDIAIYDRQYTPMLLELGDTKVLFAESVYAVLEVKQEISKTTIGEAAAKAASVRNLVRTAAPIPHAGGVEVPRPHFDILAGIVATASSWTPPMGEAFRTALNELTLPGALDIGCVAHDGAFSKVDDGPIKFVDRTHALAFFALRLTAALQRVATVPAIEFGEYEKLLGG